MLSIYSMLGLLYVFFLHFIGDFYLQDRETARKKSLNKTWLFKHAAILYCVFQVGTLAMWFLKGDWMYHYLDTFGFSVGNVLIHALIDWNIWKFYRLTVRLRNPHFLSEPEAAANWRYWEDHVFHLTLGFDQFLHAATLIVLYRFFAL